MIMKKVCKLLVVLFLAGFLFACDNEQVAPAKVNQGDLKTDVKSTDGDDDPNMPPKMK